jgi:hypothetical protein
MVTESMKRVFGVLSFLAFVSLFGTLFYYGSVVTVGTMALATVLAALATLFMMRQFPIPYPHVTQNSSSRFEIPLLCIGFLSLGALLFSAFTHPITSATRSLWLFFSPAHILLFGTSFFCTLLLSRISIRLSALLGALTGGCAAALAAILFPLGFGFDPFLHRATLTHIIEFGTITPKPFYYIGAYMLELFGSLLFRIPLFHLDVFLAPIGFTFLAWIAFRARALHPITLCLLPFAAFISTTPQAIGFLWIFATILALRLQLPKTYGLLFAIAAFVAHPIAGVPAILLVTLSLVSGARCHEWRLYAPMMTVFTLLGVFGLPTLFFVQHILLSTDIGFSFAALTDFSRIPALGFFSLQGHALLDTVMFVGGNLFLITTILAAVGIAYKKTRENLVLFLAGVVAFGNFLVLSLGFDFPFLISYERTDFALRMIIVTWLFLLPLTSDGIAYLSEHVFKTRSARAYGTVLATLFLCANVYVAYPRHDGYTRSAAFNVTPADIEIVHRIADDANETSYVVLSNQTLAAAAIQELGFFQYYHGDIFAYPIPTSSPLYDIFLSMIEHKPTLEKVQEARNLTGASTVYFVVHDYWWEANDRIAEAKKITDDWLTSDDGTVTVFIFSEKAPQDEDLNIF